MGGCLNSKNLPFTGPYIVTKLNDQNAHFLPLHEGLEVIVHVTRLKLLKEVKSKNMAFEPVLSDL